jgi:hypothetical protein
MSSSGTRAASDAVAVSVLYEDRRDPAEAGEIRG